MTLPGTAYNAERERQIARWKEARARMAGKLVNYDPPSELAAPVIAPEPEPEAAKPFVAPSVREEATDIYRREIEEAAAGLAATFACLQMNIPTPTIRPSGAAVLKEVAYRHGFVPRDLTGPSRVASVVEARHLAMWEVHQRCRHLSIAQIGRLFGNRDHTTALFAIRKIERRHEAVAMGLCNVA